VIFQGVPNVSHTLAMDEFIAVLNQGGASTYWRYLILSSFELQHKVQLN